MTGTHLIEESGILQGPIILTNTASLGTVRSYIIQYGLSQKVSGYLLPVVAETDDSLLNNINNNSITQEMVVSAYTDAPLLPHQLKRLARRGGLGIARTGTSTHDDSGELCIAFSTTFTSDVLTSSNRGLAYIDNGAMDPLFPATVQATEMAIISALLAATQVTGPDNFTATKLPTDKLAAAFNQYNPMTAIFLY